MNNFAYGSFTATGAAINIELGWLPDRVEVINFTDSTQMDIWQRGMADGTSVQINTAVAPRAANGISSYAGDSTHRKGFTVGTGIATNAKVMHWCAFRYLP